MITVKISLLFLFCLFYWKLSWQLIYFLYLSHLKSHSKLCFAFYFCVNSQLLKYLPVYVPFLTFIPTVKIMFLCNFTVTVLFPGYCRISPFMFYFTFGKVLIVFMRHFPLNVPFAWLLCYFCILVLFSFSCVISSFTEKIPAALLDVKQWDIFYIYF